MSDDQLNGLRLPPRLVGAFGDGTWTEADKHWKAVFPADEVGFPTLYNPNFMRQLNSKWQRETRPEFVGVADGSAVPGALDPARSLLIGELQGDTMIALDYRDGVNDPSVVFLNVESRWVKVAENFDEFWRRLAGGPCSP